MGDRKVIEEIRGRNEREFEKVVNQYSRLLWKVASSVLGGNSAREAEECVADAFIYLWEHPENYQPEKGKLSTYLATIVRSRAIDRQRKQRREREIPVDEMTLCSGIQGNMPGIEKENDNEERTLKLRECMDRLDGEEKDVLIRRFCHEQKVSEIAAALGWKTKQVENRIYQAKKKLKKWMEE